MLLAIRSHRCCCCLLQILSLGTYLLACVFFSVYSMAVDTLFLCFREYPFTSCQSSVTSYLFCRSSRHFLSVLSVLRHFLSVLSVFPSLPVCFVSLRHFLSVLLALPSLPGCFVSVVVTSCLPCRSLSLPVCFVSLPVTFCLLLFFSFFLRLCRFFLVPSSLFHRREI